MAIYGHETSYGTVTGGIDLLQALASLGYTAAGAGLCSKASSSPR